MSAGNAWLPIAPVPPSKKTLMTTTLGSRRGTLAVSVRRDATSLPTARRSLPLTRHIDGDDHRSAAPDRSRRWHGIAQVRRPRTSIHQTAGMDGDCIFCRIVAGDAPSFVVYEDGRTMAFVDRGQATYGHTLVVPRLHAADIWAISESDARAVMAMAKRVAPLLDERLAPDGLNLTQSNRPAGWQDVFHFHLHVIPRWQGDGLVPPWKPTRPPEGELQRRSSGFDSGRRVSNDGSGFDARVVRPRQIARSSDEPRAPNRRMVERARDLSSCGSCRACTGTSEAFGASPRVPGHTSGTSLRRRHRQELTTGHRLPPI